MKVLLSAGIFLFIFRSLVQVAQAAPYSVADDAPPLSQPRRGCGVHITQSGIAAAEKQFQTHRLAPMSDGATATIDVHFHIIFANETVQGGYIPSSAINSQMQIMNQDYKSTGITWNLSNVTRIKSESWFNNLDDDTDEEKAMKKLFRQGDASTLNVYTIGFNTEGSTTLGYATFPINYRENPQKDGVVLRHTTLPGGNAPFNLGRTLVHEAGHWAGLYHTFQGGCTGQGDQVDDTPAEKTPSYGCAKVTRDTCPGDGPDPVQNFMDYADDACMQEFTKGQAKRMRGQLRTYRNVKFTDPNALGDEE